MFNHVVFLCASTNHFLEVDSKEKMNKQMRRLKYQPIEDYDGKRYRGGRGGRDGKEV